MLGIGDFIVREINGKSELERALVLGTATGLRLASGIVFTVLISLLVLTFEKDRELALVTIILAQLVFIRSMCAWNETLYIGLGNPILFVYLETAFITIEAIGGVILAILGYRLLEISVYIVAVWWLRLAVSG
jgi:hypothetical protein